MSGTGEGRWYLDQTQSNSSEMSHQQSGPVKRGGLPKPAPECWGQAGGDGNGDICSESTGHRHPQPGFLGTEERVTFAPQPAKCFTRMTSRPPRKAPRRHHQELETGGRGSERRGHSEPRLCLWLWSWLGGSTWALYALFEGF